MSDFHGEPTHILENKFLQLEYLSNSLRIVRFSLKGKANLFAELGSLSTETPYGKFHFRGGHRLWHSPEAMPRTYIPDNEGAVITEIPNGVRIEMPTEPWTNIAKSIEIQMNPDQPQAILHHEMRNDGAWPVQFSAWPITMLKLGGVGIFPQPVGNVDEAGLLANRQLILWPYAQINDSRVTLRDDFILVHATSSLPPFKFGYFSPHGWQAYWVDGVLFVKRFEAQANAQYPDHGCNTESYFNDKFIELESLSPLETVSPGQTITHTELWEVYESLDVPFISQNIRDVINSKIK
jgi:hypothetical protein